MNLRESARIGRLAVVLGSVFVCIPAGPSAAAENILTNRMVHLRSGETREWADFPEQASGPRLVVTFASRENKTEQTLFLRHRDIKHGWRLSLNGEMLGRLDRDEADTVSVWAIAPGVLKDGANQLLLEAADQKGDDIYAGDIRIVDSPVAVALNRSALAIKVVDDAGEPLPCRLTIVDQNGSRIPTGAKSDDHLAVRVGMIYSGDGVARLGVAPGRYTIYAGRGLEYSVAKATVLASEGETQAVRLSIRRELDTPGYVSCDTHVHTLEVSGHGDSSLAERMLSIAGEGLELAIATEHNIHADYEPLARRMGLRKYFTPVIGNEYTTKLGHFNIFPIQAGAKRPDPKVSDWAAVFGRIESTPGVRVAILNHARDNHGGFRPFGPKNHNALVGVNLDGWKLPANAMEVVNSGALQTDVMRLYHDWFGLLNRGLEVAPIGSSDSHDVARRRVAQGCTYIRCKDNDAGKIDVAEACDSLRQGRVLVSMGLLTEMTVNGRFLPGDLAPVDGDVRVDVQVRGPSWARADHVALYANGVKIREAEIEAPEEPATMKWRGSWTITKPKHDLHLAVIATGPAVKEPFWNIPKTYQPTSPVWKPYIVGSTGAVWVDADGDGKKTCAADYAERVFKQAGGDLAEIMKLLASYDEMAAAQVAHLLAKEGKTLLDEELAAAVKTSSKATQKGFQQYFQAWKLNQASRAKE